MSDPQVRVDVRANTGQLKDDLRQAEAAVKDFSQETSRVEQPLNAAAAAAGRLGGVLGTLAGVALLAYGTSVVARIKETIEFDDAIGKAADRLGYSTEQLSKYAYAAKAAGVPQEHLNAGLTTFNQRIDEALQGQKQSADLFSRMGVSLDGLSDGTRTVNDVFVEFVDRLAHIEGGAGRTRIATQAFGGAAEQLLPVIKDGAIGLRAMGDEAERAGKLVDEQAAKAAGKFNDELERLMRNLGGAGRAIAKDLVGPLGDAIGKLNDAIKAMGLLNTLLPGMGPSAGAIANPGPRILELEETLSKLRGDQSAIQGSRANQVPILRSIPVIGTAGDLAALELQIAAAERELGQLKSIQNVRVDDLSREQVHRVTTPAPDITRGASSSGRAGRNPVDLDRLQKEADDAYYRYLKQQADEREKVYEEIAKREAARVADLMKAGDKGQRELYENQTRRMNDYAAMLARVELKNQDSFDAMRDSIEGWGRSFSRTMGEAVVTGNLSARKIGDAFKQLAADIVAKQFQRGVTDPLMQVGSTFLKQVFGITDPVPEAERPTILMDDPTLEQQSREWEFAAGGIMTGRGPLPLRRYERGGIARRPQVAVYGEGAQPEAFVPLPDGRRIPVAMQSTGAQSIVVQIQNTGAAKEVTEARPQVTPEGIVIQVIQRDMMTGGPISQAIERTYALGRSAA